MKGKWGKILALGLVSLITFVACFNNKQKVVCIEVWHHYDGAQKIALDKLVTEFNETEGMTKGIIVEAFNQGSIDELEKKIIDATYQNAGSSELPNVFSAYPEEVHSMNKMGIIANLDDYMKKSDISNYEDMYIRGCYIGDDNHLRMFPIAKSTDIMMINKTDWLKFSNATGADLKDLSTWEGVARVAERYYGWTNTQSPEADGGKAFFAIDDMVNYMITGSYQLGQQIFEIENDLADVKINNDIMKILWDNYYIPYVNGYYGPFNKFSSDDLKTGKILAYVASSGKATYFPDKVTINDSEAYKIEPLFLQAPNFASTDSTATLQGSAMVLLKSDEVHEKASVEFLKWLTKASNNMEFSKTTGYLPIAKALKDVDTKEFWPEKDGNSQTTMQIERSLPIAYKQIKEYNIFNNKTFNNSAAARDVLAVSLMNRAKGDRAKVLGLMENGMSREEAVNTIATDSNFEQWVVRLKMELRGVVK